MNLETFDKIVIHLLNKIKFSFARISLFIVFFWFGILKLFDSSPASPLVENLLGKTLPFAEFQEFIIFLGIVEMFIGIGFLIPRLTRIIIAILLIHMAATIMPLFMLPQIAWEGFLIPTLEGQYIIKNILIITLAIILGSNLKSHNKK